MDKKHQVVIDAQAFGSGQEQHTLALVLEAVDERYNRLKMSIDTLLPSFDNAALTYYPLESDFTVRPVSTVVVDFDLMTRGNTQ
ncbi:MAG: hypothetical protein HOG41_12800 [Gammaproteobacteria bacterium]|nr:hypothetical protein [Gammaproteobacteria bacterium]MBT7047554.1 hypothetical protein [Gammaproteobacteria bacterium]